MKKCKNVLLYQYSEDSFGKINSKYKLNKKLGVKVNPISHQKALICTKKPKRKIRSIIENFNKKHNQRIRVGGK